MKLRLKVIGILLFFVLLHTPAKTQQKFIDSIRYMLTDLQQQVQNEPIDELLQHTIPYCTGDSLNDSLVVLLKQLFSDEYLFQRGLLQPVSTHLLLQYDPFIQRTIRFIIQTGSPAVYNENLMCFGIAKFNLQLSSAPYLEEAQKIFLQVKAESSYQEARRLHYLAKAYDYAQKNDPAYRLYKQSLLLNANKTPEEQYLYVHTFIRLADLCRQRNRPDSALLLFQQLQVLCKNIYGGQTATYASWIITIADFYIYMARYKSALELLVTASAITKNTLGEESNQFALCLAETGEVYYRTGAYEKALPYSRQALDIKVKIFGDDYFDNVVNLHDIALLYVRMGLYDEAIPLLERSLFISGKYFGENVAYALDLGSLAEAYEALGEYHKALPLYQHALQIQKKLIDGESGKNNFYYPRLLHDIASLFTKLGQYDKAIELFEQALEIKREFYGKVNPEYTKTLNSYATLYLIKGDYKKALSLQQESLKISKKLFGETHPDIAAGYYNLATLYYYQNDLQKASGFCNKALQFQIKIFGKAHLSVASSYDLLGDINLQLQHNNTALSYYESAFSIRKKMVAIVHPDYIKSLYNLAVIYMRENIPVTAAALLTEADSAALVQIENSYSTLSEEEKLIYLYNRESQFQYLPSLLYLRKIKDTEIVNRVYSDAIALKSMVLFHQQQVYNSIRNSNDSVNLKLYNTWRFDKAFLGKQILLPPEKRLPDFDSLREAVNEAEQQLSRISLAFRNNSLVQVAGSEKIMQRLSTQEAAIEFIRFRLYNNNWTDSIIYAALVLLPGRSDVVFVPLFEEKQLTALLRFPNNPGEAAISYLYPPANNETEVSNKLYKLVWQPLQSLLADIHTVYYSPCGLLYRVSFAALHAGNKKMLVDIYTLHQLLCTRNLIASSEDKACFSTASLWGNIDYNACCTSAGDTASPKDSAGSYVLNATFNVSSFNKDYPATQWQLLPGTKTETENIFQLMKQKNINCMLKSGGLASEEAFKKLDGNAPGLIHIATHGFFLRPSFIRKTDSYNLYESNSFSIQKDPMFRSGLLMAGANAARSDSSKYTDVEDGVLTAYEIAQLNLSNTQLVALSACETALGDIENNEGVFGLQRAFKMAGVKQILMSLWKVPDAQTDELMLLFYASLLNGNNANTALRNAQLVMKEKFSPYYWAGFVTTE